MSEKCITTRYINNLISCYFKLKRQVPFNGTISERRNLNYNQIGLVVEEVILMLVIIIKH
jgi:hypothetical protein